MSHEPIDSLWTDRAKLDAQRIHEIDWNAKNIPIDRTDVDWLDGVYLNNPDDFPLIQFHISKSLGRVIGFFDERSCFNIVLLDPLHNLQPTKKYDYRVWNTAVLRCQYTLLLEEVARAKRKNCQSDKCPVASELKGIPSEHHDHVVSVIRFSDSAYKDALAAVDLAGGTTSITSLIEAGLIALTTGPEQPAEGSPSGQ